MALCTCRPTRCGVRSANQFVLSWWTPSWSRNWINIVFLSYVKSNIDLCDLFEEEIDRRTVSHDLLHRLRMSRKTSLPSSFTPSWIQLLVVGKTSRESRSERRARRRNFIYRRRFLHRSRFRLDDLLLPLLCSDMSDTRRFRLPRMCDVWSASATALASSEISLISLI